LQGGGVFGGGCFELQALGSKGGVFAGGGGGLGGAASSYRPLEARGQERRFSPLVHAGGALGTRGAIKNKSDLSTCFFFGFFRFY
jgi:hypothetical protein